VSRDETPWQGIAAAGAAFGIWGILPLYWKALSHIGAVEILAHRILWSVLFAGIMLRVLGRYREVGESIHSVRQIWILGAGSLFIAINWLTYIFGVNAGRVLECSLGYYINPLVNVMLGFVIFGDRPRRVQWLAIGLAAAGVGVQLVVFGRLPWVALVLAFSFGMYGATRKIVQAGPLPCLFMETLVLSVPAALYLGSVSGGEIMAFDPATTALLAGCGIVTTVPLWLFAVGARRLTLPTLGIMQYIAPTGMFLLGVLVFDEPFTIPSLVTFLFIWSGVAVYSLEGWLHSRVPTVQRA
jgi:chloramphenicol-sensitive protein RarD